MEGGILMNKQKFFNYEANSNVLDYCGPETAITWCGSDMLDSW